MAAKGFSTIGCTAKQKTWQRLQPYLLPGLLIVIGAMAYYPALELFVHKWAESEDYYHSFLVAPAIGYMMWSRRGCLAQGRSAPVTGIFLIVLSILSYLVSLKLQVPTIIFLATGMTLASVLIFLSGFRVLRELAIPLLLFFMIIPLPDQLLATVTAALQLRISEISETIIRLFSVPLYREGNILYVEHMEFQVIDACSGVRSLISMTTLSVLLGYFSLTRLWSALLLFLCSIPVAIVINIIRVAALVLVFHFFGFNLAAGQLHTLTGLGLFIFGLTLLFAAQKVLELWERHGKGT